jgi:hypothetical protein
MPKTDFENIEPFMSYISRTDRQTDILVIRIKGFHPLIFNMAHGYIMTLVRYFSTFFREK